MGISGDQQLLNPRDKSEVSKPWSTFSRYRRKKLSESWQLKNEWGRGASYFLYAEFWVLLYFEELHCWKMWHHEKETTASLWAAPCAGNTESGDYNNLWGRDKAVSGAGMWYIGWYFQQENVGCKQNIQWNEKKGELNLSYGTRVLRSCFEHKLVTKELHSGCTLYTVLYTEAFWEEELLTENGAAKLTVWQGNENTSPRYVEGPCIPDLLWIRHSWKNNPDLLHHGQELYHQKFKSCCIGTKWPSNQMSELWSIFLKWPIFFWYSARHSEMTCCGLIVSPVDRRGLKLGYTEQLREWSGFRRKCLNEVCVITPKPDFLFLLGAIRFHPGGEGAVCLRRQSHVEAEGKACVFRFRGREKARKWQAMTSAIWDYGGGEPQQRCRRICIFHVHFKR